MSTALIAGAVAALAVAIVATGAYLFWRRVWFFRNPPRVPPKVQGVVSPADGRVVYVKRLAGAEDVVHVKRRLQARLGDIVREDIELPKLLIGVFMSPLNVHFNRAPIAGTVAFVRHHAGRGRNLHMGAMHWRLLLRRPPYERGSAHIVQNERTVTKIDGERAGAPLSCYVVQIAAKTVSGIDTFVRPGDNLARGDLIGLIRIGSQVDIVVPWRDDMAIGVKPGDKVRAGETVLVA